MMIIEISLFIRGIVRIMLHRYDGGTNLVQESDGVKMLKRQDGVVSELIFGILIYGVLLQVTGIWLVKNKLLYSSGLWFGILFALGITLHMAVVIREAVNSGSGQKRVITMYLFHYGMAIIMFAAMIYLQLGNPVSAFLGIMGLKLAAYFQPLLHGFLSKIQKAGTTVEGEQIEEKENEVRA